MKTLKRLFTLLVCFAAAVSALTVSPLAAEAGGLANFERINSYADAQFADVCLDDWFYENVKSAYEFGLMIGRSDADFGTEGNITVAETMTIAARLHSTFFTGKAEFDTSEPWYAVYCDYCKENGIADPANYGMDALATRAQFAEIVANAMPDEAWEQINAVDDDAIPDVKCGDACGEAVYKLYRAGILVGSDETGTFLPDANIRRSEVAAIVTRMVDVSLRRSIRLVIQTAVPSDPSRTAGPSEPPVTPSEPEESSDPVTPSEPEAPADDEPSGSEPDDLLLPPASILG